VYQPGVPVREGVTYHGHLWLRADGFHGAVLVALEPDADAAAPYAESVLEDVRDGWRRYGFALESPRTDPLAQFVVVFRGRGRVWVDQASLLPGDAVDGVRRDVFERARAHAPVGCPLRYEASSSGRPIGSNRGQSGRPPDR